MVHMNMHTTHNLCIVERAGKSLGMGYMDPIQTSHNKKEHKNS